jgi:hypothetical protein
MLVRVVMRYKRSARNVAADVCEADKKLGDVGCFVVTGVRRSLNTVWSRKWALQDML